MILSRQFSNAIYGLLAVSLMLFISNLLLDFYNLNNYSISEPNTLLRIILNVVKTIIFYGAFWMAIAYITKEKKGAAMAFAFRMLFVIYAGYNYSEGQTVSQWIYKSIGMLSYLIFAITYFKNIRAVYFSIFLFVSLSGLSIASWTDVFYEYLNNLLRSVDLYNVFEIQNATGKNSFRTINPLISFLNQIYLPISFIIFWSIFNLFKGNHPQDFSLKTITITKLSKVDYSIFYWLLRIALFISAFGLIAYLEFAVREGRLAESLIYVLFYSFTIFILASIYRNITTLFFINHQQYPSWLYWLLNIPFLNILAWLYSVIVTIKPMDLKSVDWEREEKSSSNIVMKRANLLKEKFNKFDGNYKIKITLISLIILKLIYDLYRIGSSFDRYESGVFTIIMLVLAVVASIWYMYDKRAMFILFGFEVAILLAITFLGDLSMIEVVISYSLVNLFVYYPLFHFDHMKFEAEQQ